MDWENGFAVSEREVIDIKIRYKTDVFFFRCKMKRKMERKAFRCKNITKKLFHKIILMRQLLIQ